jgi:hypothetical protein
MDKISYALNIFGRHNKSKAVISNINFLVWQNVSLPLKMVIKVINIENGD